MSELFPAFLYNEFPSSNIITVNKVGFKRLITAVVFPVIGSGSLPFHWYVDVNGKGIFVIERSMS